MPDAIILLIGAFVTLIWGSMVGALLYAATHPVKRTNTESVVDFDKLRSESDPKFSKQNNG